jgi:hypothetical protein
MSEPAKRPYVGWCVVRNIVLEFCVDGETTTHTAAQIARLCDLKKPSVRAAANYLGIKLKPDLRGGRRWPANQHEKKKLNK